MKQKPIITNVNDLDEKFCTCCETKNTAINFYDVSIGPVTVTICQKCADDLKANL
jgi:hypothetical protein